MAEARCGAYMVNGPDLQGTTDATAVQRRSPTLLRALLLPWKQAQSRNLEHDQRFSWFHCLVSVFSYLLMLSDVPRTGLGMRELPSFSPIEPDQLIVFGPHAYGVTKQLLTNDTKIGNTRFWPYKYDSTSVSMRAVAKHLAIREWPACVMYDETCDELGGIPPGTVITMIDALIDRVQKHRDPQGSRGRLTLRTQFDWCDRLHSYAFPAFFSNVKPRTVQATYYDLEKLNLAHNESSLCGSPSRAHRPLTCGEAWTNYGRLCGSKKPLCREIGRLHSHVPARLQKILDKFPNDNHKLDFVLVEGGDDLSRSSLTHQGYKNIDVAALVRIQKCTSSTNGSTSGVASCETILVDDYRYEVVSLVTNVRDWFWVTAILRGTSQLYVWMRLVFLFVGCYRARANEPHARETSVFGRIVLALRTLFMLPSQVILYGSLFPISCYLVAHLIDSAAVYEVMRLKFSTVMGVVSLDIFEIVHICAVSMRSLWLLAFVCHIAQRVATNCTWTPIHGVPGIPEFSLSFIASITILAQVKYPSLRISRVVSVEEVSSSSGRYYCDSMQSDSRYGFFNRLVFGTVADYKCLAVSICVHLSLVVFFRALNFVIPQFFPYRSVLFSHTVVPYSTGALWSTSALVVSWNGTFLAKTPSQKAYKTIAATALDEEPQKIDGQESSASEHDGNHLPQSFPGLTATSDQFTATFHHHVTRSRSNETLIFLMNLGVMTDPIIFFRLRMSTGPLIGVYTKSKRLSRRSLTSPTTTTATTTTIAQSSSRNTGTTTILLLPLSLSTASTDSSIDWNELELQLVVHSSELDWSDLLHCG